jgi:HAD superfamily hydrolase (TIGR01458 family)
VNATDEAEDETRDREHRALPPARARCAIVPRVAGTRWDALLIDIDGVLHVGPEPIEGAREALAQLRGRGIPFRLVTNTTSRSRRLIVERLVAMGFDVEQREVLTPATLAVRHCRERGYVRVALHVAEALQEDLQELAPAQEGDVQAVILGDLGQDFTYARLNSIFQQLQGGAELVALQRNRAWQTEHGLVLDAGPFVVALEYATGRDAVVTGKPSPTFFAAALGELGLPRGAAVAMVGDDVEADVAGAIEAGLDGVLVRTGKFRQDTLESSSVLPTLVWDSIAELGEHL